MPDESAQPSSTPHHPTGWRGGLAYVIIAAFALTLVAAILVKVPETVSGPLPWCRSRNRSGTGGEERVLVEVRVAEGDNVTRGSTLFLLRSASMSDRAADRLTLEKPAAGQ